MDSVFICGVSRGIGLELATLFCGEGRDVYGIARSAEPERPVAGLHYRGIAAETFSLSAFPELADQTFEKIILNSAVFGPPTQFSFELGADKLQHLFNVNAVAHYRVLRELRPRVRRSPPGQIWFVISRAGLPAKLRDKVAIAYRSTKAAQIALALSLVKPLEDDGLLVYLVNPGSVSTRIGGPRARLSPREAAQNLKQIFAHASDFPSGTIFDHDGRLIELNFKVREPLAQNGVSA